MLPILHCLRDRLPEATTAVRKAPNLRGLLYLLLVPGILLASCRKDESCENCPPAGNKPPVADAGPDQVIFLPQDSALLDGSASADPDGRIARYQWRKLNGPSLPVIRQPDAGKTLVQTPDEGAYLFELEVTDDKGAAARDTVQVTVVRGAGGNQPPVALAGADRVINLPANSVQLDGSASHDPDGFIVTYAWRKIGGPASFTLTNAHLVQAEAGSLVEGMYAFELQVTDGSGLTAKDTVQVTVAPAAVAACGNSNRPRIPVRLEPAGVLSQPGTYLSVASAGNKILFAGRMTLVSNTITPSSRVDIYDLTTGQVSTAELSVARYSLTAVVLGQKIFLAGGEVRDGTWPVNTVDIYDVGTNTWTTAALSVAGHSIAAAAAGNKLLFAGGDGGFTGHRREYAVDIYDGATHTWSTATLSEAKRGGQVAVTVNNKVYISGGEGWPPNHTPGTWFTASRIDVYDAATNSWSASAMQEGKMHHAAVAVGNNIFWAGGTTGTFATSLYPSCVVEIWNTVTGNSTMQHLSAPALFYTYMGKNAVVKDNKVIFYSHDGNRSTALDIYDLATGTWSIGVLPINLVAASIISVNNTIYMAGGTVDGLPSNKIWKLEF